MDSAISTASTNLTSAFTGADDAIKARLNSGGDIATSLAAANSYAYTKAAADTAVASSVSALRAEISGSGGTIDARVLVEANARATVEAGLLAQYNLKVVATRSDGTKVLGMIGLASTANNVGSQSQIILQADTLSFVPSSNPDAAPVVPMTVGLVNGVTTLIVPAARIGDLTVGTTALANNASSKMVGATVNYSTTAIVTLVINAADIPNGGSTVPVLIIGSTDTFSNPLMDISVYAGAGPGWDGAGSLLAAQPPAGVCCSVHVVNLAAGTYTVACYNHGASSSPYQYDPYTRVRSIACLVAKK